MGSLKVATFPGMEVEVARQQDEAALFKAMELTKTVNTAKADVSAATGELERESALFRHSGANGQDNLF